MCSILKNPGSIPMILFALVSLYTIEIVLQYYFQVYILQYNHLYVSPILFGTHQKYLPGHIIITDNDNTGNDNGTRFKIPFIENIWLNN